MKDLVLSAYRLFIAVQGDVQKFLVKCKAAGITRLRIFGTITWAHCNNMQPDNPEYWIRARELLKKIRDVGLGVDFDLEDGNNLDGIHQARLHWFVLEVLKKKPETLSDLAPFWNPLKWTDENRGLRKTYLRLWVSMFKTYLIDTRYCIINERPQFAAIPIKKFFVPWHQNVLKNLGIPKSKLIQTVSINGNQWLGQGLWPYADILAPHNIWLASQIKPFPAAVGTHKVLYSADGNHPFQTLTQLSAIGTAIHNSKAIGYECKANAEVGAGLKMNVDAMDYSVITAVSKTLNPK